MARTVGRYKLVAHVKTSYCYPDDYRFVPFTADADTSLTVSQANPSRLREMAEDLAQKLLRGSSILESRQAMDALLSMPESVALPVWRELAAHPDLFISETGPFEDRLARLNTRAADDLLADMWAWNEGPNGRGDLGSRWRLVDMYRYKG
jgi:hypothetical protein